MSPREQDELVHSMRSVLDSLPGHVRTFHLITTDFPFTYPEDLALLPEAAIPSLEASLQGHAEGAKPPGENSSQILADIPGRKPISKQNNVENGVDPERSFPVISSALASRLSSHWRVAQVPTWLNFARRDPASPSHPYHPASLRHSSGNRHGVLRPVEANFPVLRYATHSEVFHLPTMERDGMTGKLGEREWRQRNWQDKALPSFNSMAIESRVGWLPGLVSLLLLLC